MSAALRVSADRRLSRAAAILGWLDGHLRATLPVALRPKWPVFLEQHRAELLDALVTQIEEAEDALVPPARPPQPELDLPPELWKPSVRAEANLRAMAILAARPKGPWTDADRVALRQYSGWGGLSIQKFAARFPAGFPVPEARGLVHEYYTPLRVWQAVARSLHPFREALLLASGGNVRALEPSAGIGRALAAFESERWAVDWTAVEASAVSSQLIRAVWPQATVHHQFFEAFAGENPKVRFDLVISNPPYGPRGEAAELDPDTQYRTGRAYVYFVRRALDLLRPGGIGVFLVPTGLMGSKTSEFRKIRAAILRRHHLLAAFRMPSEPLPGGTLADVVYENFVTDLLFFRARVGELREVLADDVAVLEGQYFEQNRAHILGTEINAGDEEWEPGRPKPRYGYQVQGRFQALPAWEPRPMVDGQSSVVPAGKATRARGGISREIRTAENLPPDLDSAVRLGMRADSYLAAVSRQDPAAVAAWPELHEDLVAWRSRYGDPLRYPGLLRLIADRITGAERFRACWTPMGLVEGLQKPPMIAARYPGAWNPGAVADWLFRQRGHLTTGELADYWRAETRAELSPTAVADLVRAGWCLDGERWDELLTPAAYYTGYLWPRVDRAAARAAKGDEVATEQLRKLREAIGWKSGPAILKDTLPVDSWLPLDLLATWLRRVMGFPEHGTLVREDGLLGVEGFPYTELVNTEKQRTPGATRDFLSFLGWANLDLSLWKPDREDITDPETGKKSKEPMEDARKRQTDAWTRDFRAWCSENVYWLDLLEERYNREIRGFVPPAFSADPLGLVRWNDEVQLRDHQIRGARKLIENRSGLCAFDVGLGKTYTGIATIAAARQQGWARRPVVLVPNSIVWKWYRDFARCLPGYRVLVIGSERRIATRGARKGRLIAEPDTGEQRAQKWTQFQAGEADVVLLTYSALGRQKIDPEFVQSYVAETTALRRSIALALKNDGDDEDDAPPRSRKELSERKQADMEERTRAWVGAMLAPPKRQDYDPGIDWHALGIDLLVVDEAQNFKNLFFSAREGEKKDTRRAWQLDFRAASVRKHADGAGVILLSATPAKNSPVEFFTSLHLVRPDVWKAIGIDNHESFLTRFGDYALRSVPDPGGQKLVTRNVIVSFKNLDELQGLLYRWSEFRTAEEVGLKLPDAIRRVHTVKATAAQEDELGDLYDQLADVEESLTKVAHMAGDKGKKALKGLLEKKRGLAMRIYLTYLHPSLPGIGNDQKAIAKADPEDGPKLLACADQILATAKNACSPNAPDHCLSCGHIVFVDNVSVHTWMRTLLIKKGIAAERIAILNADEASDLEYRQQIVEGFNGVGDPDDDEYTPPKYDVVIANAVAYEGMDLQRRTCAIHHLDVPWEPATLQQRNGRGVRQGNLFEEVVLHYYFVEGSNEIWRVERIERKRGWMSSLVAGQARATNTTTETDSDDAEKVSLNHARPEARERILRARQEAAAAKKADGQRAAQEEANRELAEVGQLWRRADRERDPERQAQIRAEAEAGLTGLRRFPADLWPWPWHDLAWRVRERALYVPARGPALAPGDRISLDGKRMEICALGERAVHHQRTQRMERGVWLRAYGELRPETFWSEEQDLLSDKAPVLALSPAWDSDEEQARLKPSAGYTLGYDLVNGFQWPASPWHRLPPALQEALWPELIAWANKQGGPGLGGVVTRVPALTARGALVLLRKHDSFPTGGAVLPSTLGGWSTFLALAPHTPGLTWTEADRAARHWWSRTFPRGVLGRDAEEKPV